MIGADGDAKDRRGFLVAKPVDTDQHEHGSLLGRQNTHGAPHGGEGDASIGGGLTILADHIQRGVHLIVAPHFAMADFVNPKVPHNSIKPGIQAGHFA